MGKGARPAEYHSEERLEREASALVAVQNGSSIKAAAELWGVPYATLYSRVQLHSPDSPDREERLKAADERLLELTYVTAEAAQAELARRVTEEPESLTPKELVPIAGMSQDKLAQRRQWGKQSSSEGRGGEILAKALEKMAHQGGGKLTIELETDDDAIDVTPEKS